MDKKLIQDVVNAYVKNRFTVEANARFVLWLRKKEDRNEKDMALTQFWNELENKDYAFLNTEQALIKTKEKMREVQYSGTEKKKQTVWFTFLKYVSVILLPLLFGTFAYLYTLSNENAGVLTECFVGPGEQRLIVLSDGSNVFLNSGSTLVYPTTFTGTSRTLYLTGEGHFTVTKDTQRPFIVKTDYMNVQALGTVFNISSYANDRLITTTLEEGRVKVTTKTGSTDSYILTPNQQLVFDKQQKKSTREIVNASVLSGWKDGELNFTDMRLEDILRKMERHYNVTMVIDNTSGNADRYNIKFAKGVDLKYSLRIVSSVVRHMKYRIEKDNVYIEF